MLPLNERRKIIRVNKKQIKKLPSKMPLFDNNLDNIINETESSSDEQNSPLSLPDNLEQITGEPILKNDTKIAKCFLVRNDITINEIIDPMERHNIIMSHIDIGIKDVQVKVKIEKMIARYHEGFFIEGDKIKTNNFMKHKITLTDKTPVFSKPYKIKESMKEPLENIITQYLHQGIIEEAKNSSYNNPLIILRKKDSNNFRIVSDFRKLNAKIQPNHYPVPNLEDILFTMSGKKFFSTLDIASAYYALALDDESKPLTAFTTHLTKHGSRFMFKRASMGIVDAGASFIRLMDHVLRGLINKIVFVYVDDCIVPGETVNIALANLETVMKRLAEANLKISIKKSHFLVEKINFLGHCVDKNGVSVNIDKQKAIMDFPRPISLKTLRSFLGLSGFYRRYVNSYSEKAAPLLELLKINTKFKWSEEAQKGFETIKSEIAQAPTLSFLNPDHQLEVICDASSIATSGILVQIDPVTKEENPISFCSRKLSKTESCLSSTERELIAIVASVCISFRSFLMGKAFVIKTDSRSLYYILKNDLNSTSDRIIRLKCRLNEFLYSIVHQSGKSPKHLAVDILSRTRYDRYANEADEDLQDDNERIFMLTRKMTREAENRKGEYFDQFCKLFKNNRKLKKTSATVDNIDFDSLTNINVILTTVNQTDCPTYLRDIITEAKQIETFEIGKTISINRTFIIVITESSIDAITPKEIFKTFENLKTQLTGKSISCLCISFTSRIFIPENELMHIIDFIFENEKFKIKIYKNQLVIITSEEEMLATIKSFHENLLLGGHRGINAIYNDLKGRFKHKNLKLKIADVIKRCHDCQVHKRSYEPPIPLRVVSSVDNSFEKIHCDAVGPLRVTENCNRHILVLVCEVSRWCIARPVTDLCAETVAKVLVEEVYLKFGSPRFLIVDGAKSFGNQLINEICKFLNIKKITTTPYHSQSNGLVERKNQSIKHMIKFYINEDMNDWDTKLPYIVSQLNFNHNEAINMDPFSVVFGRPARKITFSGKQPEAEYNYQDYHAFVKQNIYDNEQKAKQYSLKKRQERKTFYDKNAKEDNLEIGMKILEKKVYIEGRKMRENFSKDPLTITQVFESHVEALTKDNKIRRLHKDNIRLYFD
jgi:RNase H-like domain found in reverse transcriptase/Reverse transcriptase (RNA-dependent DNA polymerase)/Integrase zinc binding domain/Integrase core domain